MQAAKEFSELSPEHRAVVIQPGIIFGKRFLKNGKSLPLGKIFNPISYLMPWQFVCVERISERITCEMICDDSTRDRFIVIENSDI